MIKYQYCKNQDGEIIDILNLGKKDKDDLKFYCVGCGSEMIARLGNVKVHHFAHKKHIDCSEETYLHLLGKELFYKNYVECINKKKPFVIEMYQKGVCSYYKEKLGIECNLEENLRKYDLTKYFDKVLIEKKESGFVPDLMLISKSGKEKLFIEIAVTHSSTQKKIESKYRIIEINVEKEKDLEVLNKKFLSCKTMNIEFFNFEKSDITHKECKGNCKVNYGFFTLNTEGKCLLNIFNLKTIYKRLKSRNNYIIHHEIIQDIDNKNLSREYLHYVASCANKDYKVRNCFICRYHAYNDGYYRETDYPIFCKFQRIECNSNQATSCEYYRMEKDHIRDILEVTKEI